MTVPEKPGAGVFRLRLPASSANLGSGFDAAAVAFDFFLEIEAEPAAEFSIAATGRDAARCARLEDNLVVETYKLMLRGSGRPVTPLAIRMVNSIPLGMGCGSSAAALLAAITFAVHFGQLGWDSSRILEEATALEGHPDNVSACWLGGFVAAARVGKTVHVAQADPPAAWRPIIALPAEPLATSKARSMLPPSYPMADVVSNLQSAALLSFAFAQARGDLLAVAMRDRIHQPYRTAICPLLTALLPLVGKQGILGAALSGAGPGVLVIVDSQENLAQASAAIRKAVDGAAGSELILCDFLPAAANRHCGWNGV